MRDIDRTPVYNLKVVVRETGLQTIDRLIDHPVTVPNVAEADAFLVAALRVFFQQRTLIEADVLASVHTHGMSIEQTLEANACLGDELAAALELGDQAALVVDTEWLKTRLAQHEISPERLSTYLAFNQHAVQKMTGIEINPVADWLVISLDKGYETK